MDIQKLLSQEEIAICKKEQEFLIGLGIEKSIKDIAIAHNFVQLQKKESINLSILKEYEMILLDENETTITIARKENLTKILKEDLETKIHKKVRLIVIPANEFNEKYNKIFTIDQNQLAEKIRAYNDDELDKKAVLEIYEDVLKEAIFLSVSDIHINEYSEYSWIRYRINGTLEQKYIISKELVSRIALIIKELSNLDIVQTSSIQSSSFSKSFFGRSVDFRVEFAPSQYGENIVIRILDKDINYKPIYEIFPKSHPISKYLYPYLKLKDGFFLVVGPTGSGKTTTLNAIISNRDRLKESIYTIEDPIEYKIDFVTQYQVQESTDRTFAKLLKSIMRQDPDVIVVGEMRDASSIDSALKASHSGHMVYSTLHTRNAFLAIQRIKDEKGDLFILANSLSAIIAQRLVPKLCECKVVEDNPKAKTFFKTIIDGYKKNGCIKCNFSGLNGRELLVDSIFVPNEANVKKLFYKALQTNDFSEVRQKLHILSYYDCAKYLYINGICDFETLHIELKSLGT